MERMSITHFSKCELVDHERVCILDPSDITPFWGGFGLSGRAEFGPRSLR